MRNFKLSSTWLAWGTCLVTCVFGWIFGASALGENPIAKPETVKKPAGLNAFFATVPAQIPADEEIATMNAKFVRMEGPDLVVNTQEGEITVKLADKVIVVDDDRQPAKLKDAKDCQMVLIFGLRNSKSHNYTAYGVEMVTALHDRVFVYHGPITEIKDTEFTQEVQDKPSGVPSNLTFKNLATYHVEKETQFIVNGKPATLKDLKVGQVVQVTFRVHPDPTKPGPDFSIADWNDQAVKVEFPSGPPSTQCARCTSDFASW